MWRTPEELVEIGFSRTRVVMMNEAHDGEMRCIRTREIGRRVLPIAHRASVRYLAMEALWPDLAETANRTRLLPEVEEGLYPSQLDMRLLIQDALDLGWMLIAYEPEMPATSYEPSSLAFMNWREVAQARNLVSAFSALSDTVRLFVWCGWTHHRKTPDTLHNPPREWVRMGCHFAQLSGTSHFAIDQTETIFPSSALRHELDILSTLNAME